MRVIDITAKMLFVEIVKCIDGGLTEDVKLEWIKRACEMVLESWDAVAKEGIKPGVPVVLKVHGHTIEVLVRESGSAEIKSDLPVVEAGKDEEAYNSAVDGLESLILAHACSGVNIADARYIEGIRSAVEAIAQNA